MCRDRETIHSYSGKDEARRSNVSKKHESMNRYIVKAGPIYWSLRNVPELASLAPAVRRRVHEACLRRHFWEAPATRRSLIAYLIMVSCPVPAVALMAWLAEAFCGATPFWLIVVVATVAAMFGNFVFSRIAVTHLRKFYSDYIRKEEA